MMTATADARKSACDRDVGLGAGADMMVTRG
jgi:hypothetical protein